MREWRETVVGREVGGVIPDQKKKKNGDGEVSEGEGRGLQLLCESFAI